jgi:hypothetical protein
MTDRMGTMSRMLAPVHLLVNSAKGLTLDEMPMRCQTTNAIRISQ